MAEITQSHKYLVHDDRRIANDQGPFEIDRDGLLSYFDTWLKGEYDYFEAIEVAEGDGAIITIERMIELKLSYVHIVLPDSPDLYAKHKSLSDNFITTVIGKMPSHFFLNDSEVARAFTYYVDHSSRNMEFDWVDEKDVFSNLK